MTTSTFEDSEALKPGGTVRCQLERRSSRSDRPRGPRRRHRQDGLRVWLDPSGAHPPSRSAEPPIGARWQAGVFLAL